VAKLLNSNLHTLHGVSLLKMCQYKQISWYVLLDAVIRCSVNFFSRESRFSIGHAGRVSSFESDFDGIILG